MADTFQQFGPNFQIKLIAQLLKYPQFTTQISEILHWDFFDSEANKYLVKTILDYYQETKLVPTPDVLYLKLKKSNLSDTLILSIVDSIKKIYNNMNETDDEFIKGEGLLFCKNQRIKSALLTSVNFLKAGKYENIRSELNLALNSGLEVDFGLDYNSNFEERYDETIRKCIPTPWPQINELMQGGLGKGELGTILGAPGTGKSWVLVALGAHALKLNKNVLHYTLELSRSYTGLRYDAYLSGYGFQDLKYHKDDIKKTLKEQELGKLLIKHYPAGRATADTFYGHIKQIEGIGFKPDIIIVDYADEMSPIKTGKHYDSAYEIGGSIFTELRALFDEMEVPGWTGTQGNRSLETENYAAGHHVSDSYKKLAKGDFTMGWQRRMEDKINNTGMVTIIKNRFGPDGLLYPVDANMTNGHIILHDTNTVIGKKKKSDRDNNEKTTKKLLKNKLDELGLLD